MTDFDKLIREKTEQAEYAYKPSAWRNFRRVSGSVSPLRYWIVGSVSAVLISGAVLTALHFAPNRQQTEAETPSVVAVDSTLADTELQSGGLDTVSYSSNTVLEQPIFNSPKKASASVETSNAAISTTTRGSDSVRQPQSVRLGRPLVIDVDTIKENVPTDEELRNGHSRLF